MPYSFERKKVGILIFPDVEVLDFCGPFEVFSVIRLKESKRLQQPSPFEVYLIAESQEVVVTSGGLRVLPDYTIGNCPVPHILVIPGGWGVRKEINNKRLISWIYRCSKEVETLTSVCTGAILLGQAGLLDGRSATTHWRSLDWMRNSFKNVNVVEDLHVVEDGSVITSAGISAGIDMALRVVAKYFGEDIARSTARYMEYPFPETNPKRVTG